MHLSKQTEEGKGPRFCQIDRNCVWQEGHHARVRINTGLSHVTPVANAQATGREAECIALYRSLEDTHPNARIKRQAANLRFIMEAPKLKLGPDERVVRPRPGHAQPLRVRTCPAPCMVFANWVCM